MADHKLIIEHIDIDELTPYANNSKIHSKAQIKHIANSIQEFGFNDPLAIAGVDNIVLEGNGRIEAAKLLGLTTLPCVRLDHLTPEEQRAYVIAHNSLCLETGFDDAALFKELEQLKNYDFADFSLDTEKYITTLEHLQRKDLTPIQKAHYLVTVDVNDNDKIIDIIVKRRGMGLRSAHHITKTDNKSVASKVFLRKKSTEHLDEIRVLDLFAGNNVLWNCIDKIRHYGVELVPDKGANLTADAKQAVRSLDLSRFNVIVLDSYGIPFEICSSILEKPDVKSGTVIICTAIKSIFTQLPKVCIDALGIQELYKIAPSLFNEESISYFYDMLAKYGVRTVHYYEVIDNYTKHYGYFIVP